jgi:hypothetical protein
MVGFELPMSATLITTMQNVGFDEVHSHQNHALWGFHLSRVYLCGLGIIFCLILSAWSVLGTISSTSY